MLTLCKRPPEIERAVVAKRDKDDYRLARRAAWGDAWGVRCQSKAQGSAVLEGGRAVLAADVDDVAGLPGEQHVQGLPGHLGRR